MEALQVLEHLRTSLPTMVISQDGCSSWVQGAKDLRGVVYRITFAYDPRDCLWKMCGTIRIRYKINTRVKMYIKALQHLLENATFTMDVREPCFIQITEAYEEDSFLDTDEKAVARELYEGFTGLTNLMGEIARLAHVSCRLAERGGTHKYRVVLPTRLAELTVCSLYQPMS